MAFSATDPVLAHSLWLQLRSSRRRKSRRPRWRSDLAAFWGPILLLSILAFGYMIMAGDSFENVEQPAQNEAMLQEAPVLGGLARP